MKVSDITEILKGCRRQIVSSEREIKHLLTDSRRLATAEDSLFFAIVTSRNSGVNYISDLYNAGVRSFVVPEDCNIKYDDANFWYVTDVVEALQKVAAWHRGQYSIPVIGITGSNGKTIVKDWLVQLLSPEGRIASSPKSYNSQIGVPLSVWQLGSDDRMAVFEAGISMPGEMTRLEKVVRPTLGIITNIGQAHDENFLNRNQKIEEKLLLFTHCETLIYCSDHRDIDSAIRGSEALRGVKFFSWGSDKTGDVQIVEMNVHDDNTEIAIRYGNTTFNVTIPFVDRASQENAMHCIALMLFMGYSPDVIVHRVAMLAPVEMRLEINEATDGSILVNDSYSLDINSLTIALDYISRLRQHSERTLIISDILQTGVPDNQLYRQVAALVSKHGITHLVGIGESISRCRSNFSAIDSRFYTTTEEFIADYDPSAFVGQTILLKGARLFGFERIAKLMQRKNHETVMEVNLDALVHNLNYFRSRLNPATKTMAMVKAASYGAGRVEVAAALQYNHVDYLTVAYADEGVELRRGGITLPIMVMNPEEASFDDIINYRLEPDIYSFRILHLFAEHLQAFKSRHVTPFPIHIEFDTGMHRLGFTGNDRAQLGATLEEISDVLSVQSVFTHLACADDPAMDAFTETQISRFRQWSEGLPGLKHILNSSGITRFPSAQMDMVRLGIGLYGISPEPDVQAELKQVSRLVTRISQIKDIPAGDTVGYNCRWRANRDSRIAIVPIGYADGLHRGLGYGRGRFLIAGSEAPVIGSVCMDMCFVDVTDIPCSEGDRVVIFGEGDLLQRNAAAADTISYELLTAVSPRVKRIYYHEE